MLLAAGALPAATTAVSASQLSFVGAVALISGHARTVPSKPADRHATAGGIGAGTASVDAVLPLGLPLVPSLSSPLIVAAAALAAAVR